MAHKHSVYDSDTHFEINPITKGVKNASSQKTTLMQYDHNSERFTFSLPRKIEEHDMSLCDKVRVHYINIDATNKYESIRGVYEVNDLQISPEDENVVICSWLISGNATQLAGQLNFRLQFLCYAEDGVTIDYAWHTAIHTGIFISDGINNSEMVIEQYSDVLAQWERDLFFDVKEKIAENAAAIGNKQNTLASGVNIKTINGESILGAGNIESEPSDWNAMEGEPGHVLNRTHYSYNPFKDMVFNFATADKLESMDGSSIGFGTIYKISDYPLTGDDFNNSMTRYLQSDGSIFELSLIDSGNSVEDVLYLYYIYAFGESNFGAVASIHVPGNYMGLDFSRGTFITMFVDISGVDDSIKITREVVAPLPEKYIPPEIARIKELEDTIESVRAWTNNVLRGFLTDMTTTEVGSGYFESALLRKVHMDRVKRIGREAFYQCPFLKEVTLPSVTNIEYSAFYGCKELENVYLGLPTSIGYEAFKGCSKLTSLHISGTSKCNISDGVFEDTPFEQGEGTILVPNNLLDEYKNDSNWSKYASVINGYEP